MPTQGIFALQSAAVSARLARQATHSARPALSTSCPSRPVRRVRAQAGQDDGGAPSTLERITMMSVDDLPDGDVCDDFVCNSSPAVAQTVRQLARDLSRRFEVAQSSVADKVTYKDPLRSFEGRAGYEQNYIATNVTNPQGTVTRMQMEGNKTAVISWTLRGAINGQDVEIDMRDEFDLNLISGRVEAHRCAWDLSRCSATGKLAFQATRAIWSVSAALATKEKQDEMKNDDAMSSMDLNSSGMPSDPTKFFQGQQNNNDQEFQDAVTFAGALAVLWLLAKALEEVSKIGG